MIERIKECLGRKINWEKNFLKGSQEMALYHSLSFVKSTTIRKSQRRLCWRRWPPCQLMLKIERKRNICWNDNLKFNYDSLIHLSLLSTLLATIFFWKMLPRVYSPTPISDTCHSFPSQSLSCTNPSSLNLD